MVDCTWLWFFADEHNAIEWSIGVTPLATDRATHVYHQNNFQVSDRMAQERDASVTAPKDEHGAGVHYPMAVNRFDSFLPTWLTLQ